MIPFLRKKTNGNGAEKNTADAAPVAPPATSSTAPGVQMLKEVWQINTGKRQKEMPPPNVSTDIYAIPKQRQEVPRRIGGKVV